MDQSENSEQSDSENITTKRSKVVKSGKRLQQKKGKKRPNNNRNQIDSELVQKDAIEK